MNLRDALDRWFSRHLGGNISFMVRGRRVVLYGHNAMHFALNFQTHRWGWVCFHPYVPILWSGWGWYFYVSPNATPNCCTFTIGPGVREERQTAKLRREMLGHNFDTRLIYDGPHQALLG